MSQMNVVEQNNHKTPEEIKEILFNHILYTVNKPARYMGKEIGSYNKKWDSCSVKVLMAFPDIYELGISNLGCKIFYNLINGHTEFLADRAYAPDKDFKEQLKQHHLPIYGVDTYHAMKAFDIVGFTLQYELHFTTVLEMLYLSGVPVFSTERTEQDPIIIAGGPCTTNPAPMSKFIDAFIIGDGEEVFIEILKIVEHGRQHNSLREEILMNIAQLTGVYVPRFYNHTETMATPLTNNVPPTIRKRVHILNSQDVLAVSPTPYIQIIHDRAPVELRRGCARMCRFCQPGMANLPVRERTPDEIVNYVEKALTQTGYDEYSLLSLSSTDYKGLDKVINYINKKYSEDQISISLPSQRLDTFNITLAEELQSVRKSTLTFAPEAGSARMRNVINKNIDENEIIETITSAYQAGWNKVKLYFIIGLPGETEEDLQAILDLIQNITRQCDDIRKLETTTKRKRISLTATLSTFVPKPFTPFQWSRQNSLQEIEQKQKFMLQQAKSMRLTNVKLNYHESRMSQLEALINRGGYELNDVIYAVWQKGGYLEAWEENLDYNLYRQAAETINLNIQEATGKEFSLDAPLPWDMIQMGIDKEWLKTEYLKAQSAMATESCEVVCSDCGICPQLKTAPRINSKKDLTQDLEIKPLKAKNLDKYFYRLTMVKKDHLKFISHLDWSRLIYRACRMSALPLVYSQGFNPMPKISIKFPLPLFVESRTEYVDIVLKENINPDDIKCILNQILPTESQVLDIHYIKDGKDRFNEKVTWAEYMAYPLYGFIPDLEHTIHNLLLQERVEVKNFHIGKNYTIQIAEDINCIEIVDKTKNIIKTRIKAGDQKNTRIDTLLKSLDPTIHWHVTRTMFLDEEFVQV